MLTSPSADHLEEAQENLDIPNETTPHEIKKSHREDSHHILNDAHQGFLYSYDPISHSCSRAVVQEAQRWSPRGNGDFWQVTDITSWCLLLV